MLKFGASFCLNKSLVKAPMKQQEPIWICRNRYNCFVSVLTQRKAKNKTIRELRFPKHPLCERYYGWQVPCFILLVPITNTVRWNFPLSFNNEESKSQWDVDSYVMIWHLNRDFSDSTSMFFDIHWVSYRWPISKLDYLTITNNVKGG